MKKKNGFTLAELLIVVTIIAVLVAIAIPIFSQQLEKSREATDIANVRSAYAQVMAAAISDDETIKQPDGTFKMVVSPLKQKEKGFQAYGGKVEIGGIKSDNTSQWIGTPIPGGSCTVTYYPAEDKVILDWGDESGGDTPGGDPSGGGSGSTSTGLSDAIKTSIKDSLKNRLGTPHSAVKVTININNGVVSTTCTGNKDYRLSNDDVIGLLKNISGVTFDESDHMYSNGELVTDTVELSYNSGHGYND